MASRNQPAIEILRDLVNRNRIEAGLTPVEASNFRVRDTRRYSEDLRYDTVADVGIVETNEKTDDIVTNWSTVYYSRASIIDLLGEERVELPYKPEYATIAAVLDDVNAAKGTALTSGDIVDADIEHRGFEPSVDYSGKFQQDVTVFCNPTGIVFRGCFVVRLISDTDPFERFR